MAHAATIHYRCTRCGKATARDKLVAVKVAFKEMGVTGRVLKSRTVDWLCPEDVAKDPVWRSEKFSDTAPLAVNSGEQLVLFGG